MSGPNEKEIEMVPNGRKATAREWLDWIPFALGEIERLRLRVIELHNLSSAPTGLTRERLDAELQSAKCPECAHPFSDHDWGYEGEGECSGHREREEFDDTEDEGPFSCYCLTSPAKIEIAFLRAILESSSAPTPEMES